MHGTLSRIHEAPRREVQQGAAANRSCGLSAAELGRQVSLALIVQ